MLGNVRKKFIGDKQFYKMVLAIAIPIMIQNGITNFVSLLDNIMVGQIGTEQMSGVAIVNQLIFVYNLCIFGGVSGAGIFTAQYFGQKDDEGIRHTFRFKLWVSAILTALVIVIFIISGESLIQIYLNGSSDGGDLAAALRYGRQYMLVMLCGLPAFMMVQTYASTLRECGETMVPMKAGTRCCRCGDRNGAVEICGDGDCFNLDPQTQRNQYLYRRTLQDHEDSGISDKEIYYQRLSAAL